MNLVEQMFNEMVVKKDIRKMAEFYHPDFEMIANGVTQSYQEFYDGHVKIYQTDIQYQVDIEEDTVVKGEYKTAMRVFITTSYPGKEPTEIEVILIISFKENKIYRLWELTRPDWTQMKNFQEDYLD